MAKGTNPEPLFLLDSSDDTCTCREDDSSDDTCTCREEERYRESPEMQPGQSGLKQSSRIMTPSGSRHPIRVRV